MLQIDNACIAFGEDILFSEFCMRLNKGETACIAGQSGRGKPLYSMQSWDLSH